MHPQLELLLELQDLHTQRRALHDEPLRDMEEAVFVNIVGDIHPDDIGRLRHYFGIEELDSIRYEVEKGN